MDPEYHILSEFEIFECGADGAFMWLGTSHIDRVRREMQRRVQATGKEYFAMQMRTRNVIFPARPPETGKRVFQIAYTETLGQERAALLRGHGYGVLSVMGNQAAKAFLSSTRIHATDIDFFMIGHAAAEAARKEIVDWLRPRYPATKILVLNPPNGHTRGADYNVPENGPEPWFPVIQAAA